MHIEILKMYIELCFKRNEEPTFKGLLNFKDSLKEALQ